MPSRSSASTIPTACRASQCWRPVSPAARRDAADARAAAENRLAESDRSARSALDAMSAAREARARSEALLEAARQRLADVERLIVQELESTPAALAASIGLVEGDALPEIAEIERRL